MHSGTTLQHPPDPSLKRPVVIHSCVDPKVNVNNQFLRTRICLISSATSLMINVDMKTRRSFNSLAPLVRNSNVVRDDLEHRHRLVAPCSSCRSNCGIEG